MKTDNFKQIVTQVISSREELFLIDIKFSSKKDIFVEIDGDAPVTISTCAGIYKEIIGLCEEFLEEYRLEITTPDIDKPIVNRRQYKKNIGKSLHVILNDDNVFKGLLKNVNEDGLLIEQHLSKSKTKSKDKNLENELKISFEEIKESKVILNFNN
jgi:ribosome maturation factor RimP